MVKRENDFKLCPFKLSSLMSFKVNRIHQNISRCYRLCIQVTPTKSLRHGNEAVWAEILLLSETAKIFRVTYLGKLLLSTAWKNGILGWNLRYSRYFLLYIPKIDSGSLVRSFQRAPTIYALSNNNKNNVLLANPIFCFLYKMGFPWCS